MLLRKFYVRENDHGKGGIAFMSCFLAANYDIPAPVPKKKANRVLKTDIPAKNKHLSNS